MDFVNFGNGLVVFLCLEDKKDIFVSKIFLPKRKKRADVLKLFTVQTAISPKINDNTYVSILFTGT